MLLALKLGVNDVVVLGRLFRMFLSAVGVVAAATILGGAGIGLAIEDFAELVGSLLQLLGGLLDAAGIAAFQGGLPMARQAWNEAIAQLNADVPGIWLYTPMNTAAVAGRLGSVTIDPYSWLSRLPEWSLNRGR